MTSGKTTSLAAALNFLIFNLLLLFVSSPHSADGAQRWRLMSGRGWGRRGRGSIKETTVYRLFIHRKTIGTL